MVFKKIIFQNRYVALETPSRPPSLHGKNHLKFPFWLFDTLPYTIAGKSCLVFRIINYWNVFKIHSIQELQWCVLGYGGAVTQTVSGGGRKSVRNSSSYFTFPLLPLQMYRVHHFCWQWTLVLLSAMKNYSLGAASFWNAKRAHIRWKYTTIYTSLHCPDSLLHRSTLVLFLLNLSRKIFAKGSVFPSPFSSRKA